MLSDALLVWMRIALFDVYSVQRTSGQCADVSIYLSIYLVEAAGAIVFIARDAALFVCFF